VAELTVIIAFLAGLASFLSPCVLPLIPSFLAYLAGTTAQGAAKDDKGAQAKIFLNTVFFVLGFSAVFALAGVAINTVFSGFASDAMQWLDYAGGAVIIVFGLYLTGLLKLGFLDAEHKLPPGKTRYQYLTSFLFGASFAAGWTPCVGAVLGSVLTLAAVNPATSFTLLLAYSAGLMIPFLLVGLFTSHAARFIKRYQGALKYLNVVTGVLLIIIGILVFTGQLVSIASLLPVNSFLPGGS
jgi:cytochrome c-type biogenesis protein